MTLHRNGAAVVAGDDHRGRTGASIAAIGPVAGELGGVGGGGAIFAGVLDVDENRLTIGAFGDSGNFAILWPHQEATQHRGAGLLAHKGLHRLVGVVVDGHGLV